MVPLLWMDAFPMIYSLSPYIFIFALCATSSSIMYYASINWQDLSFVRKLPYLGILSLLGYGMSARCTISVLKGMMGYGGVFERTPKYNIVSRGDDWKDKIYKPLGDLPLFETFMAGYALLGIILALLKGIWSVSFYIFVYAAGYSMVAYYTYKHNKEYKTKQMPLPEDDTLARSLTGS